MWEKIDRMDRCHGSAGRRPSSSKDRKVLAEEGLDGEAGKWPPF